MAKVIKHIARKDYPEQGIKKGDVYFQWQLYNCKVQRSLTSPSRQQLTNSGFLQSAYTIEDNLNSLDSSESLDVLKEQVESYTEEIEELMSEAQDSLSNLPEQFQDSSMLNDRISSLEEWMDNLQSAIDNACSDTNEDEIDGLLEEIKVLEDSYTDTSEENIIKEAKEKIVEIESKIEKLETEDEQNTQDTIDEISNCSYNGE